MLYTDRSISPTDNATNCNLGRANMPWNNAYLSGKLSDGTNEISVADITNKVSKSGDTMNGNLYFSAGNELTFYGQTNTALTLGNYADQHGSYISYFGPEELKISTNTADLRLKSGQDVYINS